MMGNHSLKITFGTTAIKKDKFNKKHYKNGFGMCLE